MEIEHLLKLARLNVGAEESSALAKDLEDIVLYVDQLSAVDTTGVESMIGGADLVNIMRSDEERVDSFSDEDAILEQAPNRNNRHFNVPRILD